MSYDREVERFAFLSEATRERMRRDLLRELEGDPWVEALLLFSPKVKSTLY